MRRSVLSALVVTSLISILALAQSNVGHLHGIVRDPAGSVLPGVEVTIARDAAFRRTARTDAKGEFSFRNLAPGAYTVTAAPQPRHHATWCFWWMCPGR
jgi:hypothetical protein